MFPPVKLKTCQVILLLFYLFVALPVMAQDYQLGQGLQMGRVNLGGYVNAVAKAPVHDGAELELDDLSLFLSGRFGRWLQPFIEVEYTSQPLWIESDGVFPRRGKVVLERAYNEIWANENWRLRLGKMLSPVGRWNLIHAAPLVLTTTRPLTTKRNFSEFTTGFTVQNKLEGRLSSIEIYAQPWRELAPKPHSLNLNRYGNMAGGRLLFGDEMDAWLGVGLQAAKNRSRQHWQTLFSLDGGMNQGKWSMEFQATYNRLYSTGLRTRNEWGGYLQGAYRFHSHWSTVARAEVFRDKDVDAVHHNQVLGLVLHPHPAIKWKLEYLWTEGPTLGLREGVLASLAVLF